MQFSKVQLKQTPEKVVLKQCEKEFRIQFPLLCAAPYLNVITCIAKNFYFGNILVNIKSFF